MRVCSVAQSCPTLCDPKWTVAYQAPLSMEFSKQEYWSEEPFPTPGDLPDPGIKPMSCTGRQILYHYATNMSIVSQWSKKKEYEYFQGNSYKQFPHTGSCYFQTLDPFVEPWSLSLSHEKCTQVKKKKKKSMSISL